MKILTRDDTEHDVEYVTRADAEKEIEGWKDYATDACTTLRCERDAALAREAAIIQFCEAEMGWEFFRAEFKIGDNPSKSMENAMKLRKFLSENDERMHHYQRWRRSITGSGL